MALGSAVWAQGITPATPSQTPVQIVVPAPGQFPQNGDSKAAPETPKFNSNSGEGSQSYSEIFPPREELKPKRRLPRYTGKVGDFDRTAVSFEIQGKWYRLPRSVFGAEEIRSGEKASFRMAPEQLRVYRVKR